MKISKSCTQCRIGKRKCTVEKAGRSCQQCTKNGKQCSFTNTQNLPGRSIQPKGQVNSVPASSTNDITQDVTVNTRDHLVELYLRHIHDKPHTLFHPGLLRQQVRNGTFPKAVLYGIMALAARFSDDEEIRQKTKYFFSTAKSILKMDVDNVCLENIHASILIGNMCGAEGESLQEGLFFGIAFRMANILHLPSSDIAEDSITKEIKVRTWWSLYMIDQWSSAGLDLNKQMQDDNHRLPIQETKFWSLKPEELIGHDNQPGLGLWGYMVILARIFGKIQDLHQQLSNGVLNEHHAEMITQELAREFETFEQGLPTDLHFTVHNLEQHAAVGLGQAFVALHLGYHHYATLLYFPFFDIQLSQTRSRALFASRCKHHATMFSDLLRTSHETPDCEAVYLIVAHMTVVSSAALLHTLLFGNHDEIFDARNRLCSNFEILLKLKPYWPGVDLMMDRLFTFQKVCMRSMDKTYTVDRWIVNFLLQHALPIDGETEAPATSDLAERGKFANDALSILRPEM